MFNVKVISSAFVGHGCVERGFSGLGQEKFANAVESGRSEFRRNSSGSN